MTDCPTCGKPYTATEFRAELPLFDFKRGFILCEEKIVTISPTQSLFLSYLYENSPEPCSARAVHWAIWRSLDVDTNNNLSVQIDNLRKKLRDTTITIHVRKGYGDDDESLYWLTW